MVSGEQEKNKMVRWWAENSWWFVAGGGIGLMLWATIGGIRIFANRELLVFVFTSYIAIVISAMWVFWWLRRKK